MLLKEKTDLLDLNVGDLFIIGPRFCVILNTKVWRCDETNQNFIALQTLSVCQDLNSVTKIDDWKFAIDDVGAENLKLTDDELYLND